MTPRRLIAAALAATVLIGTACGNDDQVATDPTEAPPATEPGEVDAPADLPDHTAATAAAIRDAAEAGDLQRLAELALEHDQGFTPSFGDDIDDVEGLVAFWTQLEESEAAGVTGPLAALAAMPDWHRLEDSGREDLDTDLYVSPAFMHDPTDTNRAALEEALGSAYVDASMADGQYLGWRLGIDEEGRWRFFVSGD
jgi:hypothetical protein